MDSTPEFDAQAAPATPEDAPHDVQPLVDSTWGDYADRTRMIWYLLGPGLLAVLLGARLFMIEHLGWHGLFWPLGAWAAAVALASLRLHDFRCPRCQHHFFRQRPRLLALRAQHCMHCCLPKE